MVKLPGGGAVGSRSTRSPASAARGTDELGYLLAHGAAVAAYEDANPSLVDTTAPAWGG